MDGITTIPAGKYEDPAPCWLRTSKDGKPCRPVVRCNCGAYVGLAAHHVHADGTVTRSFLHAPDGCGWHAWLKLDGYDCGEFAPE